jgi:heptaprenyl diphosphate synthase
LKTYPSPPRVAKDLKAVERGIEKTLAGYPGMLREPAIHTVSAGGKRLRPALALISGMAGDYDYDKIEPVALCAELLHTATLVHDDILDEAGERRGKQTVNGAWSPTVALATGDMLLAESFKTMCGRVPHRVMAGMTETAALLSGGEMMQQRAIRNSGLSIEEYTRRVCYKTASLFSACCELSAAASGAKKADQKALRQYGECLGMAFQIFDDVLDITADESKLGKPVGADMRDGTVTLPVIYALREDSTGELKRIVEDENATENDIHKALGIVINSGAIEQARQDAKQYILNACESINGFKDTVLKKHLVDIGDFVIDRYN